MIQRTWPKRLWYGWLRAVCRLTGVVVFQLRCEGRRHVPDRGGALILANHQSHLDPVLIGVGCNRRLNYLARKTLFGFAPFRWLIDSLDAIPVNQHGLALAGLKETLRRLKQQEIVVMFPEGSRTTDGQIKPFKSGFISLARRANIYLAPAAIEGAYDAWPRRNWLPRTASIAVQFGPAISPEETARYDDQQLLEEVERRIRLCHQQARALLQRRNRPHPSCGDGE